MTLNDELKLMIHESVLDDGSKEELLSIIESTDDEDILSDVFDILEASKEEADKYADIGKDMKDFYGKKSKDIDRKRNIKYGYKFLDGVNDELNDLAPSKKYKKIQDKLNKQDEKITKKIEKYDKEHSKLQNEYDTADRLAWAGFSSGQPLASEIAKRKIKKIAKKYKPLHEKEIKYDTRKNNLETKKEIVDRHKNDPRFLRKADKIIKESVLEAFKEGILTEFEVLEIFAEANATTKFIHQSREEAKKENSDIKKREKEIIDKIDKFDSVADTTPSDSVRAIARKKANDLLKERYKLNDKRDENEKIINVKTSKDRGKEAAKTISDLKKQIKVNEQNGKKTDTLKNEINNIIKKSKHSGNLDKKVMNREFDINKNRVERKPGAFV